jgi:hypothetical protein
MDGFVESINPCETHLPSPLSHGSPVTDGYCPADDFANIFFFGIMSGLYLFFGLGWLVACTLHRFSRAPPPPFSLTHDCLSVTS